MDPDFIALAEHRGAKFDVDADGNHRAISHPRGRPMPLVILVRPTKEEAAQAYCDYFHVKVRHPNTPKE